MRNEYPLYLNGAWTPQTDGCVREDIEPATGKPLFTVHRAGPADVETALASAAAAFPGWAAAMADVRERVLLRAADVMESRAEEFLELLVREGGKAQSIARGEFAGSVNLFRVAAGECRRHTTEMYPAGKPGQMSLAVRHPLGVILGILPFNYPLILSLRKVTQSILISLIFAAVIIAILYWYFGTEQGSSIRATGCNPAMSKAQGININFTKVLALAISNGLVGLSGGLMAQYQGFSDINMGRGAIVIGLAAVIIGEVLGEAIFRKHLNFFGRLTFVVLGGVIYYIVVGVVLWLKLPSNDLKLFTAVIVAIFLAVPYLKAKSKTSFAKAAKKGAQHNA